MTVKKRRWKNELNGVKWHKNTNGIKDRKEGGDFSTILVVHFVVSWYLLSLYYCHVGVWFLFLWFLSTCMCFVLHTTTIIHMLKSLRQRAALYLNLIQIFTTDWCWIMNMKWVWFSLLVYQPPKRNTVLNDNWNLPVDDIMHNSPFSLIITFAHLSHTRVLSFHFIVQW